MNNSFSNIPSKTDLSASTASLNGSHSSNGSHESYHYSWNQSASFAFPSGSDSTTTSTTVFHNRGNMPLRWSLLILIVCSLTHLTNTNLMYWDHYHWQDADSSSDLADGIVPTQQGGGPAMDQASSLSELRETSATKKDDGSHSNRPRNPSKSDASSLRKVPKEPNSATNHHSYTSIDTQSSQQNTTAFELLRSPICNPTFLSNSQQEEYYQQGLALPLDKERRDTPITRIHLAHMRKAGGSSLRSYLLKVTRHFNLTFHPAEGGRGKEEVLRDDTLYISHVRAPTKRILSHFKFDQRWDCQQLMHNYTEYNPTTENARPLDEWLDHGDTCAKKPVKSLLWDCTRNCFLRWFNDPLEKCNADQHEVNGVYYQAALERAQHYHLMIDTERLHSTDGSSDAYIASLENFFGGLTGIARNANMQCGKPSKKANSEHPLVVNSETQRRLNDENQADQDFVDTLSECPNGVVFPKSVTLTDFVEQPKAAEP